MFTNDDFEKFDQIFDGPDYLKRKVFDFDTFDTSLPKGFKISFHLAKLVID